MRLLLATFALALCMTPLGATEEKHGQAEPPGIGFGLMCDTPEQAKRLMALRNEGSEMPQAVGLVNQESANPSACGNALVVFRVLEEVHNARVDGKRARSIHGTGHEDDHLGGWSNEFLSFPYSLGMQGCPRSDVTDAPPQGQVNANATMYRLWPGIPFLSRARHSTEHGYHPGSVTYEGVAFFYRAPPRLAPGDAVDLADAVLVEQVLARDDHPVENEFEQRGGRLLGDDFHRVRVERNDFLDWADVLLLLAAVAQFLVCSSPIPLTRAVARVPQPLPYALKCALSS